MKIHEFDPVIYPYKLWVIIDKTPECLPQRFKQYDGKEIQNIVEDTAGMAAFAIPVEMKDGRKLGCVMFFRSRSSMTVGLIAHEASHAAKYLFDHIGADMKEHEPFEYVIEWIASCCDIARRNKV